MSQQLDPIILESIQNDVALIGPQLKVISQRVIDESISEFPIYIAAQEMVNIGRAIFDRDSIDLNWFFNATILEEFLHHGLISQTKMADFRRTFGDPKEKACIFVITGEEGHFVFVPYDVDGVVGK
ncbi:MAG: hypothetical protein AAF927_13150 [Bacteroidota bacterium]